MDLKLNAQQLLDFFKSKVSKNTLLNFEERGQIPKSKLERRGADEMRDEQAASSRRGEAMAERE